MNALNKKRRRWLEFHDQKTGGIMGLLPLIKGLPVRLTDHINRNLGLYKQTKCTIHGWTLNINEASAKDDVERVLDFQPDMIYLKFENAKWRVHGDLEQGVFPMKVTGKVWNISENTKMKAKRFGFQIVPDFGQTAHSVQGASLAAVIVDCLKVDLCTKTTEMLAAYIGLSRVRRKEALLIAEPFSPALFCHGQPPGPEILMKVLRRDITADDAKKDIRCFLSQCLCLSFSANKTDVKNILARFVLVCCDVSVT